MKGGTSFILGTHCVLFLTRILDIDHTSLSIDPIFNLKFLGSRVICMGVSCDDFDILSKPEFYCHSHSQIDNKGSSENKKSWYSTYLGFP